MNMKTHDTTILPMINKKIKFVIYIILFSIFFSILPLALYIGVGSSGCTEIDKKYHLLSIKNVRSCVFKKLYPIDLLAPKRINAWMPSDPLQEGMSLNFNPAIKCKATKELQLKKIREMLKPWKKERQNNNNNNNNDDDETNVKILNSHDRGSISSDDMENAYKKVAGKSSLAGGIQIRIQIIDGIVYGIPASCCPYSPKYSSTCCTPDLGLREKYTLAQLWQVVNIFNNNDMRSNNHNVNNENIIPNVDFLLNTQDISTKGTDLDIPVFSYSIQKCDTCKGGIAVPYSADGAALQHGHGLGLGIPQKWGNRKGKLVWRGAPTGNFFSWKAIEDKQPYSKNLNPRSYACVFSGANTDLINYAFSSPMMVLWPERKIPCNISDPIGKKNPNLLILPYAIQQNEYKYMLDIEGFSWSSRMKEIINLDMAVFRVDNDFTDFTIEFLKEDVHYIPVAKNLSNLREKVLWARRNDGIVRKLAIDSSTFASEYLSPDAEICYWYFLLNEYSKLQNFVLDKPHVNARPLLNDDNIEYYQNSQAADKTKLKYEIIRSGEELTILEHLFFTLALLLTLLIYIFCIFKCNKLIDFIVISLLAFSKLFLIISCIKRCFLYFYRKLSKREKMIYVGGMNKRNNSNNSNNQPSTRDLAV